MKIIVIGRGHSGTRAIGGVLHTSGIYMGTTTQRFDLVPATTMYEAVRMAGEYVYRLDNTHWDFSQLLQTPPPESFQSRVREYLSCFEGYDTYAWKLPETVLALPWIIQMFPDAYYIHWVRDGRDNILKAHGTDNLQEWNIPTDLDPIADRLTRAAVSWKYHEDLIAATPQPAQWLTVRFEDFVQRQGETLARLSAYLGRAMNPIPVFHDVIGRYLTVDLNGVVEIMRPQLQAHGYIA